MLDFEQKKLSAGFWNMNCLCPEQIVSEKINVFPVNKRYFSLRNCEIKIWQAMSVEFYLSRGTFIWQKIFWKVISIFIFSKLYRNLFLRGSQMFRFCFQKKLWRDKFFLLANKKWVFRLQILKFNCGKTIRIAFYLSRGTFWC